MVSLADLDYAEMGRCLLAALASGAVAWMAVWGLGSVPGTLWGSLRPAQIRWTDLTLLVFGMAVWVVTANWILEKTGSALPRVAMQRLTPHK